MYYNCHFKDVCIADQCRNLEFGPEKAFDGKRLINHTIRTVEITVSRFCENLCYMEPDCVSINLYTRADGNGNYKCELNNATHEGHEEKLIDQEMYFYHAAEVNVTFNLRVRLVYFVFLLRTLSLVFTFNCELELFLLFQDISGNISSVLFTKISSKTKHLKLLEKFRNRRTMITDNKDNDNDIDNRSGLVEDENDYNDDNDNENYNGLFLLSEQLCPKSL